MLIQRQETKKPIEKKPDSHFGQVLLENMAKCGIVKGPVALNTLLVQILTLLLLSLSQTQFYHL